jgi:hypothetical protein
MGILNNNVSESQYLYSDANSQANYKENVKRSQFFISILDNKFIQTESAHLKILNFNTNLTTI